MSDKLREAYRNVQRALREATPEERREALKPRGRWLGTLTLPHSQFPERCDDCGRKDCAGECENV